jgi:hypothetical protein
MSQQANLRVQVLGVLAVAVDGRVVPAAELASRKGRTLLKLLLARRGSVVPADVAAEALWGGRLPNDPDANLATLVSRLRAVLGRRRSPATARAGGSWPGPGSRSTWTRRNGSPPRPPPAWPASRPSPSPPPSVR